MARASWPYEHGPGELDSFIELRESTANESVNPFEADSARPRVGYIEADHNPIAIPLKRHLETASGEAILVAGTEVAIFHPRCCSTRWSSSIAIV